MPRTLFLGAALLVALPRPAPAAPYVDGDLYLLTFPYDGAHAIVHVDPDTGLHESHATIPWTSYWATMIYDPYRDVMAISRASNPTGYLYFVDADGNLTSLPGVTSPFTMASRGDGIIYLFRNNDIYKYIDAENVEHDLLDETGEPFQLGNLGARWDEAFYHAETNSLILANGDNSGYPEWCPEGDETCVLKLPLDETGTMVVGPITSAQVDITNGIDEDDVCGITPGPGGLLSVVVDTNSNNQQPRMQMLDPFAMTFSTWASNGFYIGAAATNAGAYSSVRDEVVIFDAGNARLRAFASGQVGSGTAVGDPLALGSSNSARLVEVRRDDPVGVAETVAKPMRVAISITPNPFRAQTTIAFETTQPGFADVAIYDAAGRAVRSLGRTSVAAGSNTVAWDGRTSDGRPVAPGIYFARVRTEGTVRTAKVVRGP